MIHHFGYKMAIFSQMRQNQLDFIHNLLWEFRFWHLGKKCYKIVMDRTACLCFPG